MGIASRRAWACDGPSRWMDEWIIRHSTTTRARDTTRFAKHRALVGTLDDRRTPLSPALALARSVFRDDRTNERTIEFRLN